MRLTHGEGTVWLYSEWLESVLATVVLAGRFAMGKENVYVIP